MLKHLVNHVERNPLYRIWIMSDLQQSDLAIAEKCLSTAVNDFKEIDLPCDYIWNLGDTVQGKNLSVIEDMVKLQISLLEPLSIPLRFTCGNHEFDSYHGNFGKKEVENIPCFSHQLFSEVTNWRSSSHISDFYFKEQIGELTIFFFPDHADPSGRWATSSGDVHGDSEIYPFSEEDYFKVRKEIQDCQGPVITAGHNAFAGGLRPSKLLNQILPLPENVLAHFYGHAHIGDSHWAGPQCYRKISSVDHQNIPQFDVAALENLRGDKIRSTFLEIYKDFSLGIFFREHDTKKWSEILFVDPN